MPIRTLVTLRLLFDIEGLLYITLLSFQVLMDNGKSDRITIVNNSQTIPSHHALTEYQVIESRHGE